MTPPTHILDCFNAAKNLANEKLFYVYGGGHPESGYIEGIKVPADKKAFDCSGWVSDILKHGGILDSPYALDTEAFMTWGDSGEGQFMTVFVINGPELKHCFLEFKIPEFQQYKWSMAAHSGTICGWYKSMSTKGYTARRWVG